jgi:hypothetical protein
MARSWFVAVIINLDQLIPEGKSVIFSGEDHSLDIGSVESYLKVLQAQRALDNVKGDEAAQTEFAVELVSLALPTIKKVDLLRLPLAVMMKLVTIIQDQMTEGMEDEVGANEECGLGKGELILVASSGA